MQVYTAHPAVRSQCPPTCTCMYLLGHYVLYSFATTFKTEDIHAYITYIGNITCSSNIFMAVGMIYSPTKLDIGRRSKPEWWWRKAEVTCTCTWVSIRVVKYGMVHSTVTFSYQHFNGSLSVLPGIYNLHLQHLQSIRPLFYSLQHNYSDIHVVM